MREILFRGKTTHSKKWIYGNYIQETLGDSIYSKGEDILESVDSGSRYIIPGTLGQYTGVKDKNGTKIFEGDIIQYNEDGFVFIAGYVVFKDCSFFVRGTSTLCEDCRIHHLDDGTTIEVVGNIHDNPELIK